MSETTPPTPAELIGEATALDSKALAGADRALKDHEGRAAEAAGLLEAEARALKYVRIPGLVIATVVMLVAATDRPALAVILTTFAGVVTALVLSALLAGFAALLRLHAAQAETLDRIAVLLEAPRPAGPPAPTAAELKAAHLAEIRHSIRGGLWDEAGSLVHAFSDTHPDDPEATRLADELAKARSAAGRDLLARIDAARAANDPERVIELREEARALVDAEALRTLDADLAKWFMMLIHRRLRSGTVKADVAVLAGRVAACFDGTPEGASLRASLPTLRRAAGLCARCAQPYKGIADACPACLAGASASHAPGVRPGPASSDAEPDETT